MKLDFGASRALTLVAGMSGTGKTSFALRYLVNAPGFVARFIFDADGQMARRLNMPAAETPEECEASLADGWTVFDPNAAWPGRHGEAFEWFSAWAFAASARGLGRKILVVDEVWRYCAPTTIPQPLAECVQTGRVRGLDCMFCTQRPNRLNGALTGEATELVAFRVQERNALACLVDLGAPPTVASLQRFEFLAVNLADGGAVLRGRLPSRP